MRPRSPKVLLQAAQTLAFLVTNPINIRYLTGISLSAGAVLVTPSRSTLFTDARYLEMAQKKAGNSLTVLDGSHLAKALEKVKVCGIESEWMTVENFHKWKSKYKSTKFVQSSWVLE